MEKDGGGALERRLRLGYTNSLSLFTAVMQAQHTKMGCESNYARAHNSPSIAGQRRPIFIHYQDLLLPLRRLLLREAHNPSGIPSYILLILQLGISFCAIMCRDSTQLCLKLTFPEPK